ncbi:MAG: acyltransferase [Acidimicrobiaceae bacterium]|nr:acyltransferase [Acidimicrobiaceae bacterium]MYD05477.1 acyltransferase [Acidimicrobiaceae bacterium]MYI57125.1 acyltransferase [Acidimicrobiaceae bacterium]
MSAPTTERAERPRFGYIPTFDGMRGFWVVLGPLLYHARPESIQGGPEIVPGGILSLDLFFVLSSYLIVSIALREWDANGRIDLVAYAGRRVRRLFPALFLVLAFLSIYLAVVNDPDLVDRWTGAIISALAYCANWHEIVAGVSYFEQFLTPSPLKHVWSFSIEEQFYLFAPLFLIAGLRWGGRRGREILLALSVLGALGSAWWMSRVHVVGEDPSRAYYGTDTRAQALFVGIAMALAVHLYGQPSTEKGKKFLALVAYPATAFHLWAVLAVSERDAWMFENGGFLLVAAASGAALMGLSQNAPWSPLHWFFAWSPVRYTGRISYGLYLYHWPIYLLVDSERAGSLFGVERVTGWSLLAVHLTLTLVVSVLSFHLIEQPFVKRKWPFTFTELKPVMVAFAGATAVVVILSGLLVAHTRRPPEIQQILVPSAAASSSDQGPEGEDTESDRMELPDESAESETALDDPSEGEVSIGGSDEGLAVEIDQTPTDEPIDTGPLRILTVGDSVMAQLGDALVEWTLDNPDAGVIVFDEAHIGCGTVRFGLKRVPGGQEGPVGDLCSNWAVPVDPESVSQETVVSWTTVLEVFSPDVVISYVSPWDITDRLIPGVAGDEWTNIGEPAFDEYAASEYGAAIELLTSTGAELYFLEGAEHNRPITDQNTPERVTLLNELVAAVAADSDAPVTMVDFPGWIGEVGSDRELNLRDDGLHLSREGLDEAVDWLLFEILALDPG